MVMTTKGASALVRGSASADSLSAVEADKYKRMWAISDYRKCSPAFDKREQIVAQAEKHGAESVLDLGAGSGRLSLYLHQNGYDVRMVDIADNCLNDEVRGEIGDKLTTACLWELDPSEWSADFVVCVDVLEHIPESRVPDVVNFIKKVAPHGFLQAACFKDGFGKRIGETLHLTVKPAEWWTEFFPGAQTKSFRGHIDIWY